MNSWGYTTFGIYFKSRSIVEEINREMFAKYKESFIGKNELERKMAKTGIILSNLKSALLPS